MKIIDFPKSHTENPLFDIVMSTCTKLEKGQIDDLHACCIIMDAIQSNTKGKTVSP